jgi:hypothetical protein
MGAPGYQPPMDHLPPHSPMPGAPPYPANTAHPPPPVGPQRRGTGYLLVLGAAAVAVVLHFVIVLAINGSAPSARAAGRTMGSMVFAALLTSLGVWLSIRRRALVFWQVLLIVLPAYVVVALFTAAISRS